MIYLLPGTNKAEGVVIKPLKNLAVITAFGEEQRVILKRKRPEFDETRNQKGSKKKAAGRILMLYT